MIQYNENLIAERDEEVRSIEQDVLEINDIFKDLAVMVNDQGKKLGARCLGAALSTVGRQHRRLHLDYYCQHLKRSGRSR